MDRLIELVQSMGFDYKQVNDELHMVFTSGTIKWQCACRMGDGYALVYSVYPFQSVNSQAAMELCSIINGKLADGCFYYEPRVKRVVVRSCVRLSDGFYAEKLFSETIQNHCDYVVQYWEMIFSVSSLGHV